MAVRHHNILALSLLGVAAKALSCRVSEEMKQGSRLLDLRVLLRFV
jgi:hypothetical protein